MRKATISDVARAAKTSKSTVSQYLNGRFQYMSEETRSRIADVIAGLNYSPNKLAQSLKTGRTKTIGIIVANIIYHLSTHIVRVIEEQFYQQGYHVIICNADDNPDKERVYIKTLVAKQVEGIILFPTGQNLDLLQSLASTRIPFIFIDRFIAQIKAPAFLLDNYQAIFLAMQQLVETNYRRVAIMTLPVSHTTITPRIERLAAYRQALVKYDLPVVPDYICPVDAEYIEQALLSLLALPTPPEAIILANDIVLEQVLLAVKKHQIPIPQQVALLAIDDIALADAFTPAISTISQPISLMGRQAADCLFTLIKGDNTGDDALQRFAPELKIRHSF